MYFQIFDQKKSEIEVTLIFLNNDNHIKYIPVIKWNINIYIYVYNEFFTFDKFLNTYRSFER